MSLLLDEADQPAAHPAYSCCLPLRLNAVLEDRLVGFLPLLKGSECLATPPQALPAPPQTGALPHPSV